MIIMMIILNNFHHSKLILVNMGLVTIREVHNCLKKGKASKHSHLFVIVRLEVDSKSFGVMAIIIIMAKVIIIIMAKAIRLFLSE